MFAGQLFESFFCSRQLINKQRRIQNEHPYKHQDLFISWGIKSLTLRKMLYYNSKQVEGSLKNGQIFVVNVVFEHHLEVLAEAAEAEAALEILAKLVFFVVESIEHEEEFDIVRSVRDGPEAELKTSI